MAIALWLLPADGPFGAQPPAQKIPDSTPPPDTHRSSNQPATASPPLTVLPIASELAKTLTRKDDATGGLQAVEQLLYLYRQGFGENPVGQNEDIVAMLLGENPKRTAYLPAGCAAIKDGKLVDAWGTPYWFHPVSKSRMEIRSAGPDRELFTGDDLTGN